MLAAVEINTEFRLKLLSIVNILQVRGKDYRVLKTLHDIAIEHRNIGHRWVLTDTQKKLLCKYYKANDILLYCLMSQCNIDTNVSEKIKKTMFLSIDKIAYYPPESKQNRPNFSVNTEFYTTTMLYSSLLIALILYIVFITVFKHYIWIL